MSDIGEIIDCVYIDKQHAFNTHLLQNHTIQMSPSFIPKMEKNNDSYSYTMAEQRWTKHGSCPKGTIPMLRVSETSINDYQWLSCQEEASIAWDFDDGPYFGIAAYMNVWNPFVMMKDSSMNEQSIKVYATILSCGWGVSPALFGDGHTRFYIKWKGEDNKGCYNLQCRGFVQITKKVLVGGAFDAVSIYNGRQVLMHCSIFKDAHDNWWVRFNDINVGYWPKNLFTNPTTGDSAYWNVHACVSGTGENHTHTQLGSGHFPSEGWKKAAFMKNMLAVKNKHTGFTAPTRIWTDVNTKCCYDLNTFSEGSKLGFYYGGPGGPGCDLRYLVC